MRTTTILLFGLILSACGGLAPDSPGPKGGEGGDGSSPLPTADPSGDEEVPDDALRLYGTDGPSSATGKSTDGKAYCVLEDVRTDDLGNTVEAEVPASGWDERVVDQPGRCGADLETLTWRLMNCERFGRGLPPLECDLRMVWLGREHNLDMVERSFFSHENPDGELPQHRVEARGISFAGLAENLAASQTVLAAHHSWMDSSGHRANILGSNLLTGVGVTPNGDPTGLYFTAVFITPR